MLARAGGYPVATFNGSGIPSNAPNDEKFAQMMVMGLNQAAISPEIQGQAFAQALTQALNTQGDLSEAADIIIAAAIQANQINSIAQGFAQVRKLCHLFGWCLHIYGQNHVACNAVHCLCHLSVSCNCKWAHHDHSPYSTWPKCLQFLVS
jgi:hypothetical protein